MSSIQAQVKLTIAQAQLVAAQNATAQAHRDFKAGAVSSVERGRILAKQTRLEAKVFDARAEAQGRVFDLGDA